MTTAFITHTDCLNHVTPTTHPEKTDRLKAILKHIEAPEFADLLRLEAPLATLEHIQQAHDSAYVKKIIDIANQGHAQLDADTYLSLGSLNAARRAAGGAIYGVDTVIEGKAHNAFVGVRPPGHHAEYAKAMGFCIFSNIAIAAKYALNICGLSKIAIVDFDVHHGNGTQNIVQNDPRILFISSHQMPLFPGTGYEHETGIAQNVRNMALPAHADSHVFRAKWENHAFTHIKDFCPDMLFVSAGFDAHKDDPLADVNLDDDDFSWITEKICALAHRLCNGRIVSVLEGGYCLDALARSVGNHIKTLIKYGT